MTSHERMMCTLNFREPDRVPRYFSFWPEFAESFRKRRGEGVDVARHYGSDMTVVAADETAWPSAAATVSRDGDGVVQRTGWGVLERRNDKAKFSETLETRVPTRVDPDSFVFDDPYLDTRYEGPAKAAEEHRHELAVFCKTGGPYLRAAFMRGQQDFLMDIAEAPSWVKAFVERVTDHITTVGVESIKRFGLQETGIGIYDDVCSLHAPVMGPGAYERLFLPSLCKMVEAYKAAGAAKVFHHCDGNVADLLEMWVAAGIDAVHPLEARCSPHPLEVKERFGQKLAVIGGLDNAQILPRGDRREIQEHVARLLEAAKGGGLAVAPHSIGPDTSLETMDYVCELLG